MLWGGGSGRWRIPWPDSSWLSRSSRTSRNAPGGRSVSMVPLMASVRDTPVVHHDAQLGGEVDDVVAGDAAGARQIRRCWLRRCGRPVSWRVTTKLAVGAEEPDGFALGNRRFTSPLRGLAGLSPRATYWKRPMVIDLCLERRFLRPAGAPAATFLVVLAPLRSRLGKALVVTPRVFRPAPAVLLTGFRLGGRSFSAFFSSVSGLAALLAAAASDTAPAVDQLGDGGIQGLQSPGWRPFQSCRGSGGCCFSRMARLMAGVLTITSQAGKHAAVPASLRIKVWQTMARRVLASCSRI